MDADRPPVFPSFYLYLKQELNLKLDLASFVLRLLDEIERFLSKSRHSLLSFSLYSVYFLAPALHAFTYDRSLQSLFSSASTRPVPVSFLPSVRLALPYLSHIYSSWRCSFYFLLSARFASPSSLCHFPSGFLISFSRIGL